jgi:hypothetical protein
VSLENFIPSVWAGSILRALDTLLVYAQPAIINRDYEGDVAAQGDSVRINQIGDVTVNTYSKNADMNAPEALTDAQLVLKIDQAKYFNFQIDNIDRRQASVDQMDEAARRAAYGLRKAIDGYVGSLYTDISATNQIGSDASPITGTWNAAGTMAYDRLVDLAVMLDNQDVPEDGRFCVVPPWFEAYLLKDSRFVGFGTVAQDNRLASGSLGGRSSGNPASQPNNGGGTAMAPVGRAAGFDVYKSNNVPNTTATKYKIIGGHPMAWSFVQQILDTRAYEPERRFADALKGLAVYGAKVVRPNALALLTGNST